MVKGIGGGLTLWNRIHTKSPQKQRKALAVHAFCLRLVFVKYSLPDAGRAVYQLSHDEKMHRLLQSEH